MRREYRIDSQTTVVVLEHQPVATSRGQIVFLHGLEGSSEAGYIKSFAQEALDRGFGVHRVNARTCGGTEHLCETMYHSGLTTDARVILESLDSRSLSPLFLVGFSLGGNTALKLAGELGHNHLLAGVCAVSTPIDLSACVDRIEERQNFLYARRFVSRLRDRVRRKSRISPHLYTTDGVDRVKTIREFDDRFTAPLFGFGNAANYYATQSAAGYLERIRVPALLIAAQDDPLVPFQIYKHPALERNPAVTLIAPKHGGHLGFLSRRKPRFWLDGVALDWIERVAEPAGMEGTKPEQIASS